MNERKPAGEVKMSTHLVWSGVRSRATISWSRWAVDELSGKDFESPGGPVGLSISVREAEGSGLHFGYTLAFPASTERGKSLCANPCFGQASQAQTLFWRRLFIWSKHRGNCFSYSLATASGTSDAWTLGKICTLLPLQSSRLCCLHSEDAV